MPIHPIRVLREKRAWTQEQLAAAAGIAVRTVQRAERGVLSAESRSAIAGALAVSPESLAPVVRPTIQPVLAYRDSRSAMEWLVEAFGFVVRERVTDEEGQVVHGELVLGDGVVMLTRAPRGSRWASPLSLRGKATGFLFVYVDDVSAHLAHARRAGAKVVGELEESYGVRRYRCLDPERHEWCFAQDVQS